MMKKKSRAKRELRTHFEKIPLKVVKKILNGEPSRTEEAGPDNVIVEPAPRKTEPYSMGGPFAYSLNRSSQDRSHEG